jgi:hypothetical protein
MKRFFRGLRRLFGGSRIPHADKADAAAFTLEVLKLIHAEDKYPRAFYLRAVKHLTNAVFGEE